MRSIWKRIRFSFRKKKNETKNYTYDEEEEEEEEEVEEEKNQCDKLILIFYARGYPYVVLDTCTFRTLFFIIILKNESSLFASAFRY